ncbi:MAG: hypothetical protein E7608_05195 [Ruminococcaceae bacterium]|nr:hypothetical protein [Oscillospiraceae bacterium]
MANCSWNEFLAGAKKAFNKAAVKVGDIADTAADSIKIETLKLKLCEKYEQLGKIVYEEMTSPAAVANAEKAADKAAEIDALHAQINALKEKINKRKEAKEEPEEKTEETAEENAAPVSDEVTKDEVTE